MTGTDYCGAISGDFHKPFPVQFTGSPLARWLLARLGWRVHFEGLPGLQGVLAIYPHTSNWDFVLMVLVKWVVGAPVRFWGKDTLFRIPLFGRWLRWLGGVPVDRTSAGGIVAQAVSIISAHRARGSYFWLALAPEGTRKLAAGWRSGFYQTALQAGVPLGLIRLDYLRHEVAGLDFVMLSGDQVADFARIAAVYQGVRGYRPHNAAPIQLLDVPVPPATTDLK